MKTNITLLWYWIETRVTKLLNYFGIERSKDCIPEGVYCYVLDEKRNKENPLEEGSTWTKTCKYYRWTSRTKGIACIYSRYYGFDPCLYDQCKICGENDLK